VAILHAVDTSAGTTATAHDDDHKDSNQSHVQEHDDNETSDGNSVNHVEHADLHDDNETETETD
jgi:hypothetical protein